MNTNKQKLPTLFTLLIMLCLSGTAWAQDYNVGLKKFEQQDYDGAFKEWLPLAERGDVRAQSGLGSIYDSGEFYREGTDSEKEAVKWYLKAAEQGDLYAQYRLYSLYYIGQGVEKDNVAALKWLHQAAERGHSSAQYDLGNHYKNDEENDIEACKWYLKSAEQGLFDGMVEAGWCYTEEGGAKTNNSEALKWLHKAVEKPYMPWDRNDRARMREIIQELEAELKNR